jgi:hypothetical protein
MRQALCFAFAVAMPAAVSAQRTQHAQPRAAPRIAAIAPPAPAPPAAVPQRAYHSRGGFRSDLPILLMGDGRVFADFGRGWEAVSRSCALPQGYASTQIVSPSGLQQPAVVQPTVTQPPAPGVERLPYTPPVPAQQTPSQQMAQNGGRLPEASGVRQSCWARQQDGRIVVAQP